MAFRDYTYRGMTQSLCPDCLALVPAKIIQRQGRVYFRKTCSEHGVREDFVCSDSRWFDRQEFLTPARQPQAMAVEPLRGCPYDCGLCTEHEQHTCLGVLEISSSCNLECPMCYASSAPGGQHLTLEECCRAIDHLVAAEGRPEVLQLSGGEPTIHPQFAQILEYACQQPIDIVMVNTNGVRLARDSEFLERLADWRHRLEIYLQFDGFGDDGCRTLRGESLVETKLKAIERLGAAGIHTILVCTVQTDVNDSEIGPIVEFAQQRPWITGVSFQPATYVGRHMLPDELERRVTFPDVIRRLAEQCGSVWRESDFSPLPCAHPNAHTLAYAYRSAGSVVPLARFIDLAQHIDLLSGGITFTRSRARTLINELLSRQCCGPAGCGPASCGPASCGPASCGPVPGDREVGIAGGLQLVELGGRSGSGELTGVDRGGVPGWSPVAAEFFGRVLAEDIHPRDVFRITTTSFMDAYNFDVRQAMKDCVHFVLPSGHIVPFSAYNILYRTGRVPLPRLRSTAESPVTV